MSQMSEFIQHLRRTMLARDGDGPSDGQLLACFIEQRDEAAFAALVKRHGPMVWGVCRRLLNLHDAEDAFQATFLVLVRKAASIVPREMVGNWLYGVAHQTALQARRTIAKKRAREKQVTEMPEPTAEPNVWIDLLPLLDYELSRLPDKYRSVVVLCDLEGRTRKEASRQLGCPEGTVASRLATARTMLAKRLTRHGLALTGGALAEVLSQNAASASVPALVSSSTIKTASLFAAGQAAAAGAISAQVVALTEGVLKAMLLTKLKPVAALLLLTVLCAAGGLIYKAEAFEQPNPQAATKAAVEAPPAAKKGEKAISDKERLKGTWKVVSFVGDGQPQKGGAGGLGTWIINDTTMKGEIPMPLPDGTPGKVAIVLAYMLDETTKPKSLAFFSDFSLWDSCFNSFMVRQLGEEPMISGSEHFAGIYSLANETLTVCFGENRDFTRPTAFASKPGSNHGLVVLKKVSSNYFPTKIYPLVGLAGPKALKELEARLLVWIITKTISPSSWSQENGCFSMIEYRPDSGFLLICQPRDVQEKITAFLRTLFGDKGEGVDIKDVEISVKIDDGSKIKRAVGHLGQ